MRGTYFLGNGEFETRDMPVRPLGPHDVRIQVAACGVCGTDVHICHGDKGRSCSGMSWPARSWSSART